jgi:alkylation response protein AidB-like acyl-CoA dehydrogenase
MYYAYLSYHCGRKLNGILLLSSNQMLIFPDKGRSAFEGVQFEAVDSYMELQSDRQLVYHAASVMDQHYWGKNPSGSQLDIAQWTAAAKYRAPHDVLDLIETVMTWHGVLGYTKECPLEAAYRGVRSYTVEAEGGSHIQFIVQAREIFGPESLPYRQDKRMLS